MGATPIPVIIRINDLFRQECVCRAKKYASPKIILSIKPTQFAAREHIVDPTYTVCYSGICDFNGHPAPLEKLASPLRYVCLFLYQSLHSHIHPFCIVLVRTCTNVSYFRCQGLVINIFFLITLYLGSAEQGIMSTSWIYKFIQITQYMLTCNMRYNTYICIY